MNSLFKIILPMMIDRQWATLNTIKSELPLSKDKMLAK